MKELSYPIVDHLQQLCEVPDMMGTRYRIVQEIGRGGMAIVFEAEDTQLERRVAIKVFDDESTFAVNEARVLARLEHPGIVAVHEAGLSADGRQFYVMKLVRGVQLDKYLASTSLSHALRTFQKICDVVAFAHAHAVIHRDLKPENVMIGQFGEVFLMDWGIAKTAIIGSAEPEGLVVGTRSYMAPEQARGENHRLDARTDIYSLGAILEVLIGNSPARPLRAISMKAKSSEPAGRYATVKELSRDIDWFLDGMPVTAYRETIPERISRFISRNRFVCVLILTYLLLRIAFILWLQH